MVKSQDREKSNIESAISQVLQDQEFISIKFISMKGENQLVGLITKLDQATRCVKISHDDGTEWILLDDIISIEPASIIK
jgi:hypothetical protein